MSTSSEISLIYVFYRDSTSVCCESNFIEMFYTRLKSFNIPFHSVIHFFSIVSYYRIIYEFLLCTFLMTHHAFN